MRCECSGEVMEFRIATEPGVLNCCSKERCPYKAGDYIILFDNPLDPGHPCESVLTPGMFLHACKVIA